jgi:hypothetical protein
MRQRFPAVADRLEVVPPGVNLDRFDPALVRAERVITLAAKLRLPDGAHIVLCPGRFVENHGQKTLVEAIGKLARPDLFCLFPGSAGVPTPFEKELERTIERMGLQGRVQIGPHVEDMPAAYLLADTVVATGGARRGYGRTMIEAQAMGRPVVCEQGGGDAEAVLDGITAGSRPKAMPPPWPGRSRPPSPFPPTAAPGWRGRAATMSAPASASPRPMPGCCGSRKGFAPEPPDRPDLTKSPPTTISGRYGPDVFPRSDDTDHRSNLIRPGAHTRAASRPARADATRRPISPVRGVLRWLR